MLNGLNICWLLIKVPLADTSKNPNPKALELLKANLDKINWEWLSRNPNPEAIELLKANQENINWKEFSANPAIFEAK